MKPKTSRISDDLRLVLLRDLLDRWHSFKGVPRRQLKQVLSPEEWQIYDAESRLDNFPKPEAHLRRQISQYGQLLRKADALQCRADNNEISTFPRRPRIGIHPNKPLQARAEIAYLRAWEYLEEIAGDTPGIALWFDRPLDFSQSSDAASDCAEGIPRPIWSRSQYTLRQGKPKLSQRKIARAALEASFNRLLDENGSLDESLFSLDRLNVTNGETSDADIIDCYGLLPLLLNLSE